MVPCTVQTSAEGFVTPRPRSRSSSSSLLAARSSGSPAGCAAATTTTAGACHHKMVCAPLAGRWPMSLQVLLLAILSPALTLSRGDQSDVCLGLGKSHQAPGGNATINNATTGADSNRVTACSRECLQKCWSRPTSPCLRGCHVCDPNFASTLFAFLVLPYAGRVLGDAFLTECVSRLCLGRCAHNPAAAIGQKEREKQTARTRCRLSWPRGTVRAVVLVVLMGVSSLAWLCAADRISVLPGGPTSSRRKLLVVGGSMVTTLVYELIMGGCCNACCQVQDRVYARTAHGRGIQEPLTRTSSSSIIENERRLASDDDYLEATRGDLEGSKGFTMTMLTGRWLDPKKERLVYVRNTFWNAAWASGHQTIPAAILAAFCRLLFWHWLQPALYIFVLAECSWGDLDPWQRRFGVAVAVREAGYILATLWCLFTNPAFLLVNAWASYRDWPVSETRVGPGQVLRQVQTKGGDGGVNSGLAFLLTYTLAPEKFVFMAALGRGGMKLPGFEDMAALHFHRICAHGGLISKIGSSLVIVLDLCGIGALVAAFVPGGSGLTKATRFLAIGYVASALGTVSLLGLAWLHPNKGKTSAELNSVL